MTPSRLAVTLRQIAQKIDNSKRPDRRLVARELRRVLAAVNDSGIPGLDINSFAKAIGDAIQNIPSDGYVSISDTNIPPFPELRKRGINIDLFINTYHETPNGPLSGISLNTSMEGDADSIYQSSEKDFDVNEAAKAAIESIKDLIESHGNN